MLRLIRQVVLSISFLSVSCLAAAAGASTMTYQLSGTIDAIDVIGASPIGIEVGSTFSVTVTVEDTAADFQLSSTEGWFMALSDVSVSVGTAGSSITNANLDESSTFRQEVTPFEASWWFEAIASTRVPFDGSSFLDNFGVEIWIDPNIAAGLDPNQV